MRGKPFGKQDFILTGRKLKWNPRTWNIPGEETLVRAILDLSIPSRKRKTIYFTRGHGESSPEDIDPTHGNSVLRGLIEDRNIGVSSIDLGTIDRMPNDALGLVVSGPKGVFQDKEIALIRNFLNLEKGTLFLALDPVEETGMTDRPALGLRPLLKEGVFAVTTC